MNLQNKKGITILSIIALVFNVVSDITYFVSYEEVEEKIGKYWETYYKSSFNLTAIGLLITLLNIAPYILLIVYIFKLHGSIAEAFTVPLLFITTAISACIDLISFEKEAINVIIILAVITLFAFATLNALKGLSNKKITVISTVELLVLDFISLIASVKFLKTFAELEMSAYIINIVTSVIALALLSVALLLFGLKNTTHAILPLSPKEEQRKMKNMNTEELLILLKDKLDLGIITEEEYNEERAKVINNL